MQRRSIVPWIIAGVLLLQASFLGVQGLGMLARLAHASDVHRDDITRPIRLMIESGAIDLEKAAAAVDANQPPPDSKDRQLDLARAVRRAVADPVIARIHDEWRLNSYVLSGLAAVSFACSLAIAVHTFRSRPLLNRLW